MTIPSTSRKAGPLLGTGAQTAWPFTFKVFAESDIAVAIATSLGVETALVLNTDYSVTLNANQETSPGGTVTYPISGTPLPVGSKLSIIGNLAYDQPLDLPSGGNFSPLALENELDRLTMQIQQVKETAGRALLVPVTSTASSALPAPEANKLIAWNETASALQNLSVSEIASVVAYGTAASDIFTGTGAQTAFVLSNNPAALNNLDVAIGGVTQLPGVDYTWTSGTTVTFTTAPPNGAKVLIRYMQALALGTADAGSVQYTPAGTGAVATTVQAKLRESVSVKDFGAVGDGVTDDTAAIQAAINTGKSLLFPEGTYACANLTQSTSFQCFYANGLATLKKNANGPILTSSGSDVEFNGIKFSGDSATPTYTGHNLVSSGNNLRLLNCGSRWAYARAVLATGNHLQIIGTCDIYQTTDATASGFDIELGVSGTATLYHSITNIYTSQSTGGIRAIDIGSLNVTGCQFGKLTVASGTSPTGVNGGNYTGNRILGNVSVSLPSATFASNAFSSITLTLAADTSGHALDGSNVFASGAVISDLSNGSFVVDIRDAVTTAFTPAWTASTTNPVIGNGSLTGFYLKIGKLVTCQIRLVPGSTTTFGTGTWFFSLPFIPNNIYMTGSGTVFNSGVTFYAALPQNLTDGTARMQINGDNVNASFDANRPHVWKNGDELRMTLSYYAL